MQKEQTRTHILDTAIELFWAKSYHGVNMNELSRVAQLNKATVYQHFPSKEALVLAAIARAQQRSEEYIYQASFEESDDPRVRLATIYQKAHEIHVSMFEKDGRCRGCPFVNLGVELATSNDAIRLAVKNAIDSFTRYFAKIAVAVTSELQAAEEGEVDEIACSLMMNMNGCLVQSKLENRPGAILDGQKRALKILSA